MIKINLESLTFVSNNVCGQIYFDLNLDSFPEIEWNDFVVIICNWWIDSLLNLESSNQTSVELMFMDGPFRVEVQRDGDFKLRLKFIHNEIIKTEEVVVKYNFYVHFYAEILKLLFEAKKLEFKNPELVKLEKKAKWFYDSIIRQTPIC